MNRILFVFCLFLYFALPMTVCGQSSQQPDKAERMRWAQELRTYKHDFMIKELNLTEAQQKPFFADYDEMESRVQKLNDATRELEQKIADDKDASDVEIEAAARALFELKCSEGKIELEYFNKFRETLTPRQLIKLKSVERKFTQRLIQHHRRLKNGDNKHPKR